MKYSEAFRAKMVQKMAMPGGISAGMLSAKTGVPQPTLSRWLREASNVAVMSKTKGAKPKKKPKTAREKVRVMAEAEGLSGEELGAFLRREGVHESELEQWRKATEEALGPARRRGQAKKVQAETKRIRLLERDLRRKEKALAEASALLILKKKVDAIWGVEDDATDERSGK